MVAPLFFALKTIDCSLRRKEFAMSKINPSTTKERRADIAYNHLKLRMKFELVPFFCQLLGEGFTINVQTGCSVKDLLCRQLGIAEDYLAERILTIFLNSKVVDDADSTVVNEGATLALSGPMPDLVGAVLRSGSYYAAMRSQISHAQDKVSSQKASAEITLKLLNLVVKDLGPDFLRRGISIKAQVLHDFMERHAEVLRPGFVGGELDGQPVELNSLQLIDWNTDMVLLQVTADKSS